LLTSIRFFRDQSCCQHKLKFISHATHGAAFARSHRSCGHFRDKSAIVRGNDRSIRAGVGVRSVHVANSSVT
jgi:hypothetical protein